MQKYNLNGYPVEIDMAATAGWYAHSENWGCQCSHCRNFLKLAQSQKLPQYISVILNTLGISPEKATYVSELYTDDAGVHYQFSYRLAGAILDQNGAENRKDIRCWNDPYPYGAPGFPEPHFDLEFYAALPWVLEESEP